MSLVLLVVAALVGGCSDGDYEAGGGDLMAEDLPAGVCGTTTSSGTSFSTGDDCDVSLGRPDTTGGFLERDECDATRNCPAARTICVAEFEVNGRAAYTCRDTCIELMDETVWCADATSCCDPAATCTSRGYCVIPPESPPP